MNFEYKKSIIIPAPGFESGELYQPKIPMPFFEKSQNGDKVLIYTKAKKAYLYRSSSNQLIDVTIVNINADATVSPTV